MVNKYWILAGSIALAPSAALAKGGAGCPVGAPMGGATGYNVVTFDAFHGVRADIEGKVAIGGHAVFEDYGIASRFNGGPVALSVKGSLRAVRSQVYGADARVKGACATSSFGIPSGTLTCGTTRGVEDTNALEGEMLLLSDYLRDLPVNGKTEVYAWGQVTLRGNAHRNVFTLDLDRVKASFSPWVWNRWINGFTIQAPSGSVVIVNVVGDPSIFLRNGAFNLMGGISADRVILNFHKTPKLVISNVGVKATVLAPKAKVFFDNGHIDGQMIADRIEGTGEFHDFAFTGDVCR